VATLDLEDALDWRPHTLTWRGKTYSFDAEPPVDFMLGYPAFVEGIRGLGGVDKTVAYLADNIPSGEAFREMAANGMGLERITFSFRWLMHQWGLGPDPQAKADPYAEVFRLLQAALMQALDRLLKITPPADKKAATDAVIAQIKTQLAEVAPLTGGDEAPKASRAVRRATEHKRAPKAPAKPVPAPVAKARAPRTKATASRSASRTSRSGGQK
jgi:hypothetical protein